MRLHSVLFAPASRPDLVAKAPRYQPTTIVIDLEDAVAESAKAAARSQIAGLVAELGRTGHDRAHGIDVFVRINPVDSPFFDDDVRALVPGLSGVMLPKVGDRSHVERLLSAAIAAGCPLPVFVGIETVKGVLDAREILGTDGVCAVYFGAEDYVADLGGIRTESSTEVLVARSLIAMAARVNGIPAVDQVVAAFRDVELFAADAAIGRSLGYQGKLCIHPAQVRAANQAFTPSPSEIERAVRLIECYDAALAVGVGSVTFEGQMIDEPLARQARAVVGSRS